MGKTRIVKCFQCSGKGQRYVANRPLNWGQTLPIDKKNQEVNTAIYEPVVRDQVSGIKDSD